MVTPLNPEFQFAGFTFPKYVWSLPRGSMAKRLEYAKKPVCGPYSHAPKPNKGGTFFYLESDFMPGLRWQWCDEISGVRINHTGWFTNQFQDDKIRGLVMRLPNNRGFLAGWSMGEHMASEVEPCAYETIEEAARAADSMAENVADDCREAEEKERADQEEREQEAEETEAFDLACRDTSTK